MMVPSVVVAELLCALKPTEHNAFSERMHRRFIVPPFDTKAALHYAQIWSKKRGETDIEKISKPAKKADLMIIATAIAKGAERIYSQDKGLKNLAQGYIEVKPLPSFENQMSIEYRIN